MKKDSNHIAKTTRDDSAKAAAECAKKVCKATGGGKSGGGTGSTAKTGRGY